MSDSMDIEDVRKYCLVKRGATEDCAFGPETILFRLCGKIFACLDLQRPNLVVVKMQASKAVELRERYRGITGAWHWNKRYWSDVYLDADVDADLVKSLIDHSYEEIRSRLPKKTLYNFPDLPEGWRHEHYPVLDSAMNVLRDADFRAHTSPFQLVTADFQTAGRGQGKNVWESEDKKNLLFAFRFFPTMVKAVNQFALLEVIALAVAETLQRYLKEQVSIKWPNDIYCRDRKICGILIEHDICGAYLSETRCGIGINVNQSAFLSDAPNPGSICQLVGKEVDRAAVLRVFLKIFMEKYRILQEEGEGTLKKDFLRRLYRMNNWYFYKDINGKFEACITGVQEDGRLVLKDRSGQLRVYAHKEVEYLLNLKQNNIEDKEA